MDAHSIGTIWATILFEAYWGLIQQYGFSSNWMDSKQKQGNIVMMQLLIAGLQLQPCNPSFIDARDAILLADSVYYKGIHECTLWRAFAKRGLGVSAAATGGKDGFDVPAGCK